MDNEHHETWIRNVRDKIEETVASCHKLITSEVPGGTTALVHRAECRDEVLAHLKGLNGMFGSKGRPAQISNLVGQINSFVQNRRVQTLPNLLNAISSLQALMAKPDTKISFCDIFDDYKNDEELNQLADHLIATLERLILEGEGDLSARLERDLQKLLDQLKGRNPNSLTQLAAFAEVIGRIALEIAGSKMGIPAGSLLMDLAKTAYQVQASAVRRFRENQNEFIRLIETKSVLPDVTSLPHLDGDTIQRIEAEISTLGGISEK